MRKILLRLFFVSLIGWIAWCGVAPGPDDLGGSEGANTSFSPDRRWYVEVGDGQSRANNQPYATLWIWSVEQAGKPSRFGPFKNSLSRKKALAHFTFPQQIRARSTRWE